MTGFDPEVPNTARVYSCLLGGKDHFPADRGQAGALLEIYPPIADMVRENRAFITRSVQWAAMQGIGQFTDLGSGLEPVVHEAARGVLPRARVAYIDTDPMVLSHARALLAGPGVAVAEADLTDAAGVLAAPELKDVIDPAAPVCVILAAVLHFMDAAAREVTAGYASLIAPGSCLAISVASFDDGELAERLAAGYTAGQFRNHSREDVGSFFADLDMSAPASARRPSGDPGVPVPRGTAAMGTCWPAWAGWAMRDPDAVRWTAAELPDLRRDLAMSLGLSPPYSPVGVVIRTQIAAIDTELARRPHTGTAQAGEAGASRSLARRRGCGGAG